MLSRSILRYVLVAVVSTVSATATVATAVYAHNDGFNERIVACFESRDPNSEECLSALEVSPVGADFFMALAGNVGVRPAKPEPKPEPKQDPWALLKACAQTHDLASDECQQALEASGLSEDDFKAKLRAKFGCLAAMNNDGGDPCRKKPAECASTLNDERRDPCHQKATECASALNDERRDPCRPKPAEATTAMTPNMTECLALRTSVNGLSAKELAAKAEKIAAICGRAAAESRMTALEFWKQR